MSDGAAGHGPSGEGPVDPAFEGLFRPEEPSAGSPAADARVDSPTPEPAPEPAPTRTEPVADTGRLFRSQGVTGHTEAVLALDSGRFSRLRTLGRTGDEPVVETQAVVPDTGQAEAADPAVAVLIGAEHVAPAPPTPTEGDPMPKGSGSHRGRSSSTRQPRSSTGRGTPSGAVAIVVIGVTVLVGFANAFLGGGSLGWPTGLALLASSVYAALTVRRDDDTFAFLMPPVAFLIAALTAGQLFLDANEGSIINRAAIVFFTLADNWIWIIGSTLAALIIVLVRRRNT